MGTLVEICCDCGFSDTLYMGVGMRPATDDATATNVRLHVKRAKFTKTRAQPTLNTYRVLSTVQIEQALQTGHTLPLICPYCQHAAMRAYDVGCWD